VQVDLTTNPPSPLLHLNGVKTYFHTVEGTAKAVDDVSFLLNKGETVGLVGESGCGKSVTALSIMRLVKDPPGKIVSGEILFNGTDLLQIPAARMKSIRGKRIAMIFQEPMTSLNPVYTIGDQIAEMLLVHENLGKKESWDRAVDMITKVQIPVPEKRAHEYPHQLSGGMRQRAMIAMALACKPEILIADEPTTALDVTVQAQIIELMQRLREEFGTAIILISHDLGIIAETVERIVVMYAGKVVEEGPTLSVFDSPNHPYTKGLFKSRPRIGERSQYGRRRLMEIQGAVPNLFQLPGGCAFHPRCAQAVERCRQSQPELISTSENRRVRCHLLNP
jgi:peptide/nickel transport system ATP-binding protein/oligopeptide transport system ATP-binding protein